MRRSAQSVLVTLTLESCCGCFSRRRTLELCALDKGQIQAKFVGDVSLFERIDTLVTTLSTEREVPLESDYQRGNIILKGSPRDLEAVFCKAFSGKAQLNALDALKTHFIAPELKGIPSKSAP